MRQNLDGFGRFLLPALSRIFTFTFSSLSHAGAERNVLPKWTIFHRTMILPFHQPQKKLAYLGRITLHHIFCKVPFKHIILDTPSSLILFPAISDPNCLKDGRKKAVSKLRFGRCGLRFLNGLRMVQAMFKWMTIPMTFGKLRLGVTHRTNSIWYGIYDRHMRTCRPFFWCRLTHVPIFVEICFSKVDIVLELVGPKKKASPKRRSVSAWFGGTSGGGATRPSWRRFNTWIASPPWRWESAKMSLTTLGVPSLSFTGYARTAWKGFKNC